MSTFAKKICEDRLHKLYLYGAVRHLKRMGYHMTNKN